MHWKHRTTGNNKDPEDCNLMKQHTIILQQTNDTSASITSKDFGIDGINIQMAHSGAEALELILVRSKPILVMDISFPDMTADELVRELEKRGNVIPFIIVTNRGSEKEAVKFMKLGAVDYITKDDACKENTIGSILDFLEKREKEIENGLANSVPIKENQEKKEYEELCRRSLEHCLDGICVVREGIIIYSNNTLGTIVGSDVKDILGNGVIELFPKDEHQRVKEEIASASGKETGFRTLETVIVRSDGKEVNVDLNIGIIECPGKKKHLMFIRDITGRKRAEEALLDFRDRLGFILSATRTGLDIIDSDKNLHYVDPEWRKYYGDPGNMKCYEYFMDRNEICSGCGILEAMKTREVTISEMEMVKEENRPIQKITLPYQNDKGNWMFADINVDITDKKSAERLLESSRREKELLLGEVHHRVKNNMQVISSLLKLQSLNISKDPKDLKEMNGEMYKIRAIELFRESENRIQSMALIHDHLYRANDLERVDMRGVVSNLISGLYRTYGIDYHRIKVVTEIQDVCLDVEKAIPVTLILNELLTKALKHAFTDEMTGEIRIGIKPTEENRIEIRIADNGVGIPDDVKLGNIESLGFYLVAILAEDQLGGIIEVGNTGGTEFRIVFPREGE